MKRLIPVFVVITLVSLSSCLKEYSNESAGTAPGAGQIIGQNCRISKIVYVDTLTAKGKSSLTATINAQDVVTNITQFDSLALIIDFFASPIYASDTIFINNNEYFLTDLTSKQILRLHALVDPTDPLSNQYDISYNYDASGYLTSKSYALTSAPGIPFYLVTYAYFNGNVTKMTAVELLTGDKIFDADVTYFTNFLPKNFIYVFPDEMAYPEFTQFFNFGKKPNNAIKTLKVRSYDPGNVLRDSAVSSFNTYILSRDNYVLSVIMNGDDQPSLPAVPGKLVFSYKCK